MTTVEFITALFSQVDDQMPGGARSTFPANMGNERRAGCEDTTELTTEPESSMML